MGIDEFLANIEYLLHCTLTDEQRAEFTTLALPIMEINKQIAELEVLGEELAAQVNELDEEIRLERQRLHWEDRRAIERDYIQEY